MRWKTFFSLLFFCLLTFNVVYARHKSNCRKRTKQMTRKKNMTGTGTNHFIFIHEQPPEQNIETHRDQISLDFVNQIRFFKNFIQYLRRSKTPTPKVHRNTEIATLRHV